MKDSTTSKETHNLDVTLMDNQILAVPAYNSQLQPIIQAITFPMKSGVILPTYFTIIGSRSVRVLPIDTSQTVHGGRTRESWTMESLHTLPSMNLRTPGTILSSLTMTIAWRQRSLWTECTRSIPAFDVVTGGFVIFDGSNENQGELIAIADLLEDGTLNGLNLHPYHGSAPWDHESFEFYVSSPQSRYEDLRKRHKISTGRLHCVLNLVAVL